MLGERGFKKLQNRKTKVASWYFDLNLILDYWGCFGPRDSTTTLAWYPTGVYLLLCPQKCLLQHHNINSMSKYRTLLHAASAYCMTAESCSMYPSGFP